MAQRKLDKSIRTATIETVRRLALSGADQRSSDANEWYWCSRFGHPLVDHIRVRQFLNETWWSPKDLSKEEIASLVDADFEVLARSESEAARVTAAKDERTPHAVLERLSKDPEIAVRKAVGHNAAAPSELLAEMHKAFQKRTEYRRENDEISKDRLDWLWLDVDDWHFRVDLDLAEEVIEGRYYQDRRGKLAQNRRVPPDLRRRLATQYELDGEVAAILASDPALEVRQALGENFRSAWPEEIAERLAVDDAAEVRAGIASGWGTPARLLELLATDQDPDVRIAAGGNKNLPREVLMRLLADASDEVRRRVVLHGNFDYRDLVDLDASDELRPYLHERLAYNKWPVCWGDEYTYSGGYSDAEKAKQNAQAEDSKAFLRELARSPHASTRRAVSLNTGTPEDALILLAADADETVRQAVYEILGTDSTFRFGYYSDPLIWWYRRERLDVNLLASASDSCVRALMASRAHQIGAKELHELSCDASPDVRAAAAANPRLSFEDLVRLCDDADEHVQKAAANEIVVGLRAYESDEKQQREQNWLEDRMHLPEELHELVYSSTQVRLVDHRARQFHVGTGSGSWTGWSINADLTKLASVKNARVRAAIACFSGRAEDSWSSYKPVPTDVLVRLAQDPEESVRAAAFANQSPSAGRLAVDPEVPRDVLLGFSRSKATKIRAAIGANVSTPGAALANLVRDPKPSVRAAVAGNPSTPVSALGTLVADKDDDVLDALAGNPNASVGFLEQQADAPLDWSSAVRMARIANNRGAPADALRKIAYSPSSEVRALVAANPNTPQDALEILAHDESASVRAAAKGRLHPGAT